MPVLCSSRGQDLKTTVLYNSAEFKADEKPWTVLEWVIIIESLVSNFTHLEKGRCDDEDLVVVSIYVPEDVLDGS
ncbi:hypothetical protein MRX96_003305 [Rhipicephalus microplus]